MRVGAISQSYAQRQAAQYLCQKSLPVISSKPFKVCAIGCMVHKGGNQETESLCQKHLQLLHCASLGLLSALNLCEFGFFHAQELCGLDPDVLESLVRFSGCFSDG